MNFSIPLRRFCARFSPSLAMPGFTQALTRRHPLLGLTLGLLCMAPWHAQALDVVRLGNLKFAHYGAVSYMKEVCSKHGIQIEERIFAKGPDIMPAIVSGDIDLAALASDGAISGRANGVPIITVAGFAKGGARLVAGVNSGIRKVSDLKGKKIGVTRGGMQELLLMAELEKAGLQVKKDIEIVYLAFADLNQALSSGQIDAMCQSEPQSSQAINAKMGIEIIKPYDTPLGEPYRLLVMTEKLYSEKKDLAQRTMNCFVEATTTFQKQPALAQDYVIRTLFKGQLSQQDYQDAMDNAAFTTDVTPSHVDTATRMMQQYGVGKMSRPPQSSEWVKLDLLEVAKARTLSK